MAKTPSAKKRGTIEIKMMPVDAVHLNPRNPRDNEAGVSKVAASIERFGWQQPIVVNKQGIIIAGNTRYKAAIQLGLTEVPTTLFTGTAAQENAFLIADNKVRDFSKWMDDRLSVLLAELEAEDLEATGFSQRELEKLLDEDEAELIENEEGGTPANTNELGDPAYRILLHCEDEAHQAALIAMLEENGIPADSIEAQVL